MSFRDYVRLVGRARSAQLRCAELTLANPLSECVVNFSQVVADIVHELDTATAELMHTTCKD